MGKYKRMMCMLVSVCILLTGCGDAVSYGEVEVGKTLAVGGRNQQGDASQIETSQVSTFGNVSENAQETVTTTQGSTGAQDGTTTQGSSGAQNGTVGGTSTVTADSTATSGGNTVVIDGIRTVKNSGYSGYDDLDTYFDSDKYIARRDGVDYGTLEIIQYYSTVAGQNRTAYIMLPAGYDGTTSYPVLYLAHGINCGPSSYSDIGGMEMLNNLISEGNAVPMIMVGTDNVVTKIGEESGGVWAYDRAVEDITESLMPYVNSHYKTKTGRENTAITGFSMGGRTALYAGFSRQDLFGYVGAIAPASGVVKTSGSSSRLTTLLDSFTIDQKYGGFKFLMLVAGEEDGVCGKSTESYEELLVQAGIDHMYYRCPGGHENKVWQSEFYNFVKRIFK